MELVSDNGPPFNSLEFRRFAEEYEFKHTTSSPGYPQSNGKAENAVKQMKRMMTKTCETETDPYLALLEMRNLPSENVSSSPAQRLMGRRTRTMLPIHGKLLNPELPPERTAKRLQERKEKQQRYYNRAAKDLPHLQKNTPVLMTPKPGKQRWRPAVVVSQDGNRSYAVKTEEGRIYRRNRRHLREYRPSQETDALQKSRQDCDGSLYIRVPPSQQTGAVPRLNQRGATSQSNQSPSLRSPYMLRSRPHQTWGSPSLENGGCAGCLDVGSRRSVTWILHALYVIVTSLLRTIHQTDSTLQYQHPPPPPLVPWRMTKWRVPARVKFWEVF